MIPDEREWQAQERAMQCERAGVEVTDGDAASAEYLSIARALRQPLDAGLPADFASRVANLATARVRPAGVDSRFEQGLLVVLGVSMGIAALVAAWVYGAGWMQSMLNPLAAPFGHVGKASLAWPLALASCLVLSWLSGHLHRHAGRADRHLA
jgi:hypothetical protein